MNEQFFKNHILFVSDKTSFKLNYNSIVKAKIVYQNNEYNTCCFIEDEQFMCIVNNKKIFIVDFKIIKIYNIFTLEDGSQIKFIHNGNIKKGYVHYFDPSFLINENKILVINYFNYDKTYLIEINQILGNDFTIVF